MKADKLVFGLILLALGIFLYLRNYGYFQVNLMNFLSYAFFVYGVAGTLFLTGQKVRNRLFIAGMALTGSIILYVFNNYEITRFGDIIFSSALIVTGSGFLSLFMDNTRDKGFLYSALILFGTGIFTALFLSRFSLVEYANSLTLAILNSWPYFMVFAGITMLIRRK